MTAVLPVDQPLTLETTPADAAGRRRGRRARVLGYGALVLACVYTLMPFLWAFLTSIKKPIDAFAPDPVWIFTPTLHAYAVLWEERGFYFYLWNTLWVAAITTVVSLVVAALAGYGLARYSGVSSVTLLVGALVFRALPRMALALPYYYVARLTGLYDTQVLLVIVFVAVNQPFTIWLMRNFFAAVPDELDQAAMVDGCSRLRAFFSVLLPVVRPGMVTAGVFTFLLAYQEYLLAVVLTQSRAVTLPVFIAQFSTENVQDWPVIAAGSVSLALPVIALMFFAQRYLVEGLTAGAVKS